MPIYEYSCAKCGETIEVIQKMSDSPLKTHAKCGGKLTKLISAAGFQFKGTGWYVTDYARKHSGESGESASETKTETAKAEAAKDKKEATPEKAAPAEKSTKAEKHAKSSNKSKTS
jgi:putative FmdB family regulatory protein